jgi:hypothetical protein
MNSAHRQHYLPTPLRTGTRRTPACRIALAIAYTLAVAAITWSIA